MKMKYPLLIAALVGAVAFATTVAQAQDAMPPLVKQMNNGAWPDKAANEQLIKERLYQRGIEGIGCRCPS